MILIGLAFMILVIAGFVWYATRVARNHEKLRNRAEDRG